MSRLGTPPAAGTTYTSWLPSYSPVKATIVPSGEKLGERLVSHRRGQATRIAAVAADDPQVAAVVEDDLRLADSRNPQQQRRIALGNC